MTMQALVLQHVPFEGPGSMAAWLDRRGARVETCRLDDGATLPEPDAHDLVIAMGGPMSVNDEAGCPWLADEKAFILRRVECDRPLVGVCLGAQLIASALGARIYANAEREIGWFDVTPVACGDGACFAFPEKQTVFHWHGETFDLPEGARLLASSAACRCQGFQIGRRVLGLQFHLETTAAGVEALIAHCRDELTGGAFVQTPERMRAEGPRHYERINALMTTVLDYLVD